MQFSKEDVVQLNMCSDLFIEKMCSERWFQRQFYSENFEEILQNLQKYVHNEVYY